MGLYVPLAELVYAIPLEGIRKGLSPNLRWDTQNTKSVVYLRDQETNTLTKLLEDAVAGVNKKYGSLSILTLDSDSVEAVDVISTGSLMLDRAIGVGGIPRGKITEIYGPESSGKTTLCQHKVANAQRKGIASLYIDMEHATDPTYLARTGVDLHKLLFSQPDDGTQALGIAEDMIKSGQVGLVIIDSVSSLVPKAEAEDADMGDAVMGMQARLMSQALRKINPAIKRSNTAVIFTNQLRNKIGIFFGSSETTSGGNALKFYASLRLDIRRAEFLKVGTEIVGIESKVTIKKNKVAAPFKEARFEIRYPNGIDEVSDVFSASVETGVIEQRGGHYYYNGEKLGHGRDAVLAILRSAPGTVEDLRNQVLTR